MPITMLLLVLVFGGLVAAGLPLLVGVISVLGTFLTLWVVSQVTDLSIFSINLVTAMGLGLAIDYSLFIVSRFREELRARPQEWWGPEDRRSIDAAIVRTVETAGRTVAVSALTVGVSLSALLVFPLYFLRSFAWAGIGVDAGGGGGQRPHASGAAEGARASGRLVEAVGPPPRADTGGPGLLAPGRGHRHEAAGRDVGRGRDVPAVPRCARSCGSASRPPTSGCCPRTTTPARPPTGSPPSSPPTRRRRSRSCGRPRRRWTDRRVRSTGTPPRCRHSTA